MEEVKEQRPTNVRSATQVAVALFVVVGLSSTLSFYRLGEAPFSDPDEPRYAQTAREMRRDHDWMVPHFNGELRLVKPPLFYWLIASAQATFGESEWSARFWPALLGVATVTLTFVMGMEVVGLRGAFVGSLLLTVSPLFAAMSRLATPDMLQALLITTAFLVFWHLQKGDGRQWLALLFLIILGINAWAKSPFISVLLLIVPLTFILVSRKLHVLKSFVMPAGVVGLVVFVLLCIGWQLVVGLRESETMSVFRRETISRFFEGADHPEPWWYFFVGLPAAFLPWALFMPLSLCGMRLLSRDKTLQHGSMLLALWLGIGFAMHTKSQGKLIGYMLPLLPPLALLTGQGIELAAKKCVSRPLRALSVVSFIMLALFLSASFTASCVLGEKVPEVLFPTLPFLLAIVSICGIVACILWCLRSTSASLVVLLGGLLALHVGCIRLCDPFVARHCSSFPLATQVRPVIDAETRLLSYKYHPTGMVYYLDRPVRHFRNTHKLSQFGLADSNNHLIFLRRRRLASLTQGLGRNVDVVASAGDTEKDLIAVVAGSMLDESAHIERPTGH